MSTLAKTRKKIAKKRGALNSLHEGSRDSRRLHKALVRDERLEKLASNRRKQEKPLVGRASFFQNSVQEKENQPLTTEEIEAAIQVYVHQYDEEMAELKQSRRPGRPASTREDLLKVKIAALEKEFQNGFLVPDLSSEENAKLLSGWEGSWSQLTSLKWVRITADGTVRPAAFPPNKD